MMDSLTKFIRENCAESGIRISDSECDLIVKSLTSLKCFDDWLNHPKLLKHRLSYFFSPPMSQNKSVMVFMTHPVFLRDIVENQEINEYLHGPVTLVTPPISHYLFREYHVHMYFDVSSLKSFNKTNQVSWLDIGGLLIADRTVKFAATNLMDIKCQSADLSELIKSAPMQKTAVSLIAPGVFKSDEDEKDIYPGDQLWDKQDRENCKVHKMEPGESGLVFVAYNDSRLVPVSKSEFDQRYVRS